MGTAASMTKGPLGQDYVGINVVHAHSLSFQERF